VGFVKASDAVGWAMIATVAGIILWLAISSPSYESYLLVQARSLHPSLQCEWIAPWNDTSYLLTGWSTPQNGSLWSNARKVHIVFRLPGVPANQKTLLGIRYAALTANVEVRVNGARAGSLSKTAHEFDYQLDAAPSHGAVDVQLSISNVPWRWYDGRYAGVLLTSIRACPGHD